MADASVIHLLNETCMHFGDKYDSDIANAYGIEHELEIKIITVQDI